MNLLTPGIEAVFNTGARPVHLVTLRADGRPQVTVVWTGVEDGEIVIAHLSEHQKVKNVRRDARVALSVITGGRNSDGLDEYVVVEGVELSRWHVRPIPWFIQSPVDTTKDTS